MQTSITLNAKLYSFVDEAILKKLYNYCSNMNIDMQMMNMGEDVVLRFTGGEQQLVELQEHLESVHD